MGVNVAGFNCLENNSSPCVSPQCNVVCVTEGEDAVLAPRTLSIQPAWSTCDVPDFEPYTDDCGTFEYTPGAFDEDGCLISGEPIEYDLGSVSEAQDNAIFGVINGVPLLLEIVDDAPTGGSCCTFLYETPVIADPPSLYGNASLEIGTTHLPTELLGDRIQYIGDHPATITNTPALSGVVGDCEIVEVIPAMPGGYGPIYANATLALSVCRSSCDDSWYGTVQVNFRYDYYYILPLPGFASYGGLYEGLITDTSPPDILYWHVPNTGSGANASGECGRIEATGATLEIENEDYDIFFTLSMEGGDPCPPNETTKVPAYNGLYSRHYGNFLPLRVWAVNGAAGVGDIEHTVMPAADGYEGYGLNVSLPITDGVTTIDDVLDVLDSDPRFSVADRVNTGVTLPIGIFELHELLIGQGQTVGGTNTTPVSPAAVVAAALASIPGPHDASGKVTGGTQMYSVPGFQHDGSCGVVFLSITGAGTVAEECLLPGLCTDTDATFTTFDIVYYGYCSDECTWSFV